MTRFIVLVSVLTFGYYASAQQFLGEQRIIDPAEGVLKYNWNFGMRKVAMQNGEAIIPCSNLAHVYGTDTVWGLGAVYVYTQSPSGEWSLDQRLTSSDSTNCGLFGEHVSFDQETILVSGYLREKVIGTDTFNRYNVVYVFRKDHVSHKYVQIQRLDPPNNYHRRCGFGKSTRVHGDYLILASPHDYIDSSGIVPHEISVVHIYKLDVNGFYIYHQEIIAPAYDSYFAKTISAHDSTLVVGAFGTSEYAISGDLLRGVGSAHIYTLSKTGSWQHLQKLLPLTILKENRFASSLSFGRVVSVFGDYLIVNGDSKIDSITGEYVEWPEWPRFFFHVYKKSASKWVFHQRLYIPSPYIIHMGLRLDLHKNLLGFDVSENPDTSDIFNRDSLKYLVYLYSLSNTNEWEFSERLSGHKQTTYGSFGQSFAINDETIVISERGSTKDICTNKSIKNLGNIRFFQKCTPVQATYQKKVCTSYQAGCHTYYQNGTYTDTLKTKKGCDSIVTVAVTIDPLDTNTVVSGNSIKAADPDAQYQWMDCATGTIISGETKQTFTPANTGYYAAILRKHGCEDTTICTSVTGTSISKRKLHSSFSLFPNPNEGSFVIRVASPKEVTSIRCTDISGKEIHEMQTTMTNDGYSVKLMNPIPGFYTITVQTQNSTFSDRIMIF